MRTHLVALSLAVTVAIGCVNPPSMGRMYPLLPVERQNLTCDSAVIELAKADQFCKHIHEVNDVSCGEVVASTAAAAIPVVGMGVVAAKADSLAAYEEARAAMKSASVRRAYLTVAYADLGCGRPPPSPLPAVVRRGGALASAQIRILVPVEMCRALSRRAPRAWEHPERGSGGQVKTHDMPDDHDIANGFRRLKDELTGLRNELKRHRTELTSTAVRGTNLVLRTMILGGQDQGSMLIVVALRGVNLRDYTLDKDGTLYRGTGDSKTQAADFSSEQTGRRKVLRAVRFIVRENTSRWERILVYVRFRKLVGLNVALRAATIGVAF